MGFLINKKNVSFRSFTEALNRAAVGICLYDSEGHTFIYNDYLKSVSYELFGCEQYEGDYLSQILTEEYSEDNIYYSQDGNVYRIICSHKEFDGCNLYEIIACNINDEDDLRQELYDENKNLLAFNEKIQQINDDLDYISESRKQEERRYDRIKCLDEIILKTSPAIAEDSLDYSKMKSFLISCIEKLTLNNKI